MISQKLYLNHNLDNFVGIINYYTIRYSRTEIYSHLKSGKLFRLDVFIIQSLKHEIEYNHIFYI